MRILFDVYTPAPLSNWLRNHTVALATDLGWRGLINGALLDAAERAGYDLLLTCDQSVRHQQNLDGRKLTVVVLSSNHWPTLRLVASRIATAVEFAQRGQLTRIDVSTLSGS